MCVAPQDLLSEAYRSCPNVVMAERTRLEQLVGTVVAWRDKYKPLMAQRDSLTWGQGNDDLSLTPSPSSFRFLLFFSLSFVCG